MDIRSVPWPMRSPHSYRDAVIRSHGVSFLETQSVDYIRFPRGLPRPCLFLSGTMPGRIGKVVLSLLSGSKSNACRPRNLSNYISPTEPTSLRKHRLNDHAGACPGCGTGPFKCARFISDFTQILDGQPLRHQMLEPMPGMRHEDSKAACEKNQQSRFRVMLSRTASVLHDPQEELTVFAIEEVADGAAAGCVGFFVVLKAGGGLGGGVFVFGIAAGRAAVGEAGLVGLQLELFMTDAADADRERHPGFHNRPLAKGG